MLTLHGYVLRELIKMFALIQIALATLFTMGGGLYDVLRYEGLGTGDLFSFLPLLIPLAIALTMPVAALFSVSMVYGRLAADNELLACRAAGINIHRLFLSGVLVSIFVAGSTLTLGDLVIPTFVEKLEHYARTNLCDIAYQKLRQVGYVSYQRREKDATEGQRLLLTARRAWRPSEAELVRQHLPVEPGLSYLVLDSPVVLQIDKSSAPARYATARYGLCQFDVRPRPVEAGETSAAPDAAPLYATIYVDDGREFELSGRSVRLRQQQIGPIRIPLDFPRKASMVNLATLVEWRAQPWKIEQLGPEVETFLTLWRIERFLADCMRRVEAGQPLTFTDDRERTWQISAGGCRVDEQSLLLTDARVVQSDGGSSRPLAYEAAEALLTARRRAEMRLGPASVGGGSLEVGLHLREAAGRPVREHNPRSSEYAKGQTKGSFTLPDALRLPTTFQDKFAGFTEARVFDPGFQAPMSGTLSHRRDDLLHKGAAARRKMTADINFRLGYASSSLVTVLAAAALGVIFRGARALAAFGLACIPFASVAVLMIMARQMGERHATQLVGPALTWGGLALVGMIDLLLMRIGVRR